MKIINVKMIMYVDASDRDRVIIHFPYASTKLLSGQSAEFLKYDLTVAEFITLT